MHARETKGIFAFVSPGLFLSLNPVSSKIGSCFPAGAMGFRALTDQKQKTIVSKPTAAAIDRMK